MTVQAMLAVLLSPSKLRYDAGRSLTKTKKIKAVLTGGLSIFLACLLFVGVQVFAVFWSSHKMVYASEQSFVYTAPAKMEPITTSIEVPQSAVDNVQIQSVVHAWAKKYQQKASVTILDTASGETLLPINQISNTQLPVYISYMWRMLPRKILIQVCMMETNYFWIHIVALIASRV